jgi:hypothetical protein
MGATDMTRRAFRNHMIPLVIVGGAGLIAAWITLAFAASGAEYQGAEKLIEHGNIGLMALIVVGVLTPVVAAFAWLIRKITSMFAEQLVAQQSERETMAAAHRQEREEAAGSERTERAAMCERHQQHDDESLRVLQQLTAGLDALVRKANGG